MDMAGAAIYSYCFNVHEAAMIGNSPIMKFAFTCNRSLSVMPEVCNRASSALLDSPVKPENDKCGKQRHHYSESVIKLEAGFTIVELMITMVIFVLVLLAASGIFTTLLAQFKQQSKIMETNTEGIIGLEILRRDIEHAGYGLLWAYPAGFTCSGCGEAASAPASNYNDFPNQVPRAVICDNAGSISGIVNGSDYLVIKAVNVATNSTCQKWTNISAASVMPFSNTPPGNPRIWDTANDAFTNGEYAIVLSMNSNSVRQLVTNSSTFSIPYSFSNITSAPWPPTGSSENLVYGVDPNTSLRMPFNRADYFVSTSVNPSSRCAPNTWVLEKAVVSQGIGINGGVLQYLPLLDCVANMQVVYGLAMTSPYTQLATYANGGTGSDQITVVSSEGASAATVLATVNDPALLRQSLKEVRVYILAHEGQQDSTFTYSGPNPVPVGETLNGTFLGSYYPGTGTLSGNLLNYRWRVYTLVVKLNNLYVLPPSQ